MEIPEKINSIANSDAAIIVLHEIYGVNEHMAGVCEKYRGLGYDVYCPNLLGASGPFSYEQRNVAYSYFVEHVGFGTSSNIDNLAKGIRSRYQRIFLIGFSVGATLAWICSKNGLYDGVICYYGSRIRDYRQIAPACPALLLFARHEASFSPENLPAALSNTDNVNGEVLEAKHGFHNICSPDYDAGAAARADELTCGFLRTVQGKQACRKIAGGRSFHVQG